MRKIMEKQKKYNILSWNSQWEVKFLILSLFLEDSRNLLQDTTLHNLCRDSHIAMNKELLIEILNQKIYFLIKTTNLKLLTLDLQLQLREEMEVETSLLNLVQWTTWLQRFILVNHIKVNKLMSLPPLLFFSLWLHNIHHSQPLNHLIHSTDVLQEKEETSFGELTARTRKMVKHFSLMNSKIS